MRPGVAMQRSCRLGGSGLMIGLAMGLPDQNEFCAHEMHTEELGGLEAKLLAHFFTNAAKFLGIEKNLGRIESLSNNRKVLWDARSAGLFGSFSVSGNFCRRCWLCGGGGRSLGEIAREQEFELGGVKLLAGGAEDAKAKRIDALLEKDDLCCLARDDLIALGDLVSQV